MTGCALRAAGGMYFPEGSTGADGIGIGESDVSLNPLNSDPSASESSKERSLSSSDCAIRYFVGFFVPNSFFLLACRFDVPTPSSNSLIS